MCDSVILRYKSLVGLREPPAANGDNCVIMLSKLCPLRPGTFHVGVTKVSSVFYSLVPHLFYVIYLFKLTSICVLSADFSEGGHLPAVGV